MTIKSVSLRISEKVYTTYVIILWDLDLRRCQKRDSSEMNYDLAFKKKNSFVEIFTNAQFTYSKLNGESSMETYIAICKIDSQWEFAV